MLNKNNCATDSVRNSTLLEYITFMNPIKLFN